MLCASFHITITHYTESIAQVVLFPLNVWIIIVEILKSAMIIHSCHMTIAGFILYLTNIRLCGFIESIWPI